jgi:hypothetical protein
MNRRTALITLLAVVLGGCASMRRVEVGSGSNGYAIDVYNSRSSTLTVSYTDQSGDHELGTVSPGKTQHFVIPGSGGSTVTIIGMTSSGGHYTKPVTLGTTSKVTL